MSLGNNEENAMRQHFVGTLLHRNLVDKALEESVFVVVNLLNKGTSKSLDLADLNLRAATRAKSFSAFNSQAKYAAIAISNLPSDSWTHHKALAVDAYSIAAEAAGCLGDFSLVERYCQEVLRQADLSVHEKMRCYNVMCDTLGRTRRHKEAINLALDVMEDLGFHFPRSRASQAYCAVTSLLRLKQKLKRGNLLELDEVPKMQLIGDQNTQEAVRLLQMICFWSYMSKEKIIWLLSTIRMVNLTIENGLAEECPTAIASCAVIVMQVLGNWKAGVHLGEVSQLMAEILETHFNKPYAAKPRIINNYMLLVWVKPVQQQVKCLIEGYKKSMDVGNTNIAFHNIYSMICIVWISGSLVTVEEDARIYLPQLQTMKGNENMATFISMMWQAASNLMNPGGNSTELTGIAMNEKELLMSETTVSDRVFYRCVKNRLYVYFEEYEVAAKLALSRGDEYMKGFMGTPMGITDAFFRSISLYAMAKRSFLNRKYRKQANRTRLIVRRSVENGNPNAVHYLKLLDAEHASLARDTKGKVPKLYEEAVRMSVRGGFIQDAALAQERFADYVLNVKKDINQATYLLEESSKHYLSWGAEHKVQILHDKINKLREMEA